MTRVDDQVESRRALTGHDMSVLRRLGRVALMLAAVAFSAVVYFPVTRSYFFLDDFLNLYHIVNDSFLGYLARENGGHIQFFRNLVFYATFLLSGPRPELFYWTAFLTHLLNVGLLFVVIARLTQSRVLASFGAAFWGTSPLCDGTVGWYSVYGHEVAATCLLLVLAQAIRRAAACQAPSRGQYCFWYCLALVGATSFGTGVGIALMLPFVLYLLLYPLVTRPPLISLVVVVPALYLALTLLHESTASQAAPARWMMTNALHMPLAVVAATVRLIAIGVAGALADHLLPVSHSSLTLYSILALVIAFVLIAAHLSGPQTRRQMAACVLIVLGSYGMIAVGRGPLMTSMQNETLQSFRQYHYVSPIGFIVLMCLALARIGRRAGRRTRNVSLATWYLVAVVSYVRSGFTVNEHTVEREQTREVLAAIRAASRAQPLGTVVQFENRGFPPYPFQPFVPGWAGAFTIFYPDDLVDGRHVRFVERARYIVDAHSRGSRIGRVLISPP